MKIVPLAKRVYLIKIFASSASADSKGNNKPIMAKAIVNPNINANKMMREIQGELGRCKACVMGSKDKE